MPDGRQRWREDAIGRLLDAEDVEVLFVAGCEENQVRFHPRFDLIILLSAPAGVLAERLASRTANSFGRAPGELERILDDLQGVEPLLRKAATHEIRTTMPLDDVVAEILHLAGALSTGPIRSHSVTLVLAHTGEAAHSNPICAFSGAALLRGAGWLNDCGR